MRTLTKGHFKVQIVKHAKEIRQRLEQFLAEKPIVASTFRCCFNISNNQLGLVYLNKTEQTTELLRVESLPCQNINDFSSLLDPLVKQHNLYFTPTYFLLSPEHYQLFLIEKLPVPTEELIDALKWRMKNVLIYPIEEAVVDYFELPYRPGVPSNKEMIAVIIAKKNYLTTLAKIINNSGLVLVAIDTPELALRNLTALYENDEKSSAMIYFYDKTALLNITRQKLLYFTRHISLTENSTVTKNYEEISLDIVRYFDYYQNQWRHPIPSRLFVAGEKESLPEMTKALEEHLSLTVKTYQLPENIMGKNKLTFSNFLLFGGALRKADQHVATRN